MTLVSRYQKRLSGPLLDRIDIHVEVPRVPFQKLSDERRGEASAAIRARVEAARGRQTARFAVGRGGRPSAPTATGGVKPAPTGLTCNADMGPTQVRDFCQVDETARQLLGTAMRQMQFSARAYHRILKLARTIADPSLHSGQAWWGRSGFRQRTWRRRSTCGWPRRQE